MDKVGLQPNSWFKDYVTRWECVRYPSYPIIVGLLGFDGKAFMLSINCINPTSQEQTIISCYHLNHMIWTIRVLKRFEILWNNMFESYQKNK